MNKLKYKKKAAVRSAISVMAAGANPPARVRQCHLTVGTCVDQSAVGESYSYAMLSGMSETDGVPRTLLEERRSQLKKKIHTQK